MNPLHQPQRSKLSTMKRDYQSTKSSTSDSESDSHSDSDSESEILTPEVRCEVGLNVAEFVKKHYNKLPMRTSILSGAVYVALEKMVVFAGRYSAAGRQSIGLLEELGVLEYDVTMVMVVHVSDFGVHPNVLPSVSVAVRVATTELG
jgi:hypothetical protein